jgi:transcriptional regulator with XRE-family HTH domain
MSYPEAIETIKARANKLKLSQVELADRSGMSTSYLSRIFSLEREASDQMLISMAQAVNLPPMDILQKANRVPSEPPKDETLSRINHLYHVLDEGNKQRALEFLEFLSQQEKNGRKKS